MISRGGAAVSWYGYNLPQTINQAGGNYSTFYYAPDRSRYRQTSQNGSTAEDRIYVSGLFEKLTTNGTTVQYRNYIVANGTKVAIKVFSSAGSLSPNDVLYLHDDHLGSTQTLTNTLATILISESYDAWGKRRGSNWTGMPSTADLNTITTTTHIGFTGQEELDNLSLVDLNGRVYDPTIARFMSADPHVQAPYRSQSLNRYSYTWNNPLNQTDPTGFDTVSGDSGSSDDSGGSASSGAASFGTARTGSHILAPTLSQTTHQIGGQSTVGYGAQIRATGADAHSQSNTGQAGAAGGPVNVSDREQQKADAMQATAAAAMPEVTVTAKRFVIGGIESILSRMGTVGFATTGALIAITVGPTNGYRGSERIKLQDESARRDLQLYSEGTDEGGNQGSSDNSGQSADEGANTEKTPTTDPDNFDAVRGTSGKRDKETGEIWEKDKLHKDHYEVYKNLKNYQNGTRSREVWLDGRPKGKL
jgi:RHS repeat-associated protein